LLAPGAILTAVKIHEEVYLGVQCAMSKRHVGPLLLFTNVRSGSGGEVRPL
jgi:hypothetical protein